MSGLDDILGGLMGGQGGSVGLDDVLEGLLGGRRGGDGGGGGRGRRAGAPGGRDKLSPGGEAPAGIRTSTPPFDKLAKAAK